jgi:cystathionine beta-lyase/cystathionine gamma-synthase
MPGCGGTFTFRVRGGRDAVFRLLERVKVLTLAESPIKHPVTMTHASVAPDALAKMGITPDLVRISVGIEDVEDLIGDLGQALEGV